MRILVTGASGFIGSHLCKRLLEKGHEVHGISRVAHSNGDGEVQWSQGDLADEQVVSSVVGRVRPQIIFHLASHVTGSRAAQEISTTFQANLASSVNIMTSALHCGCERVVLAGSSEEPLDGDPIPPSPYAAAKVSSSIYARMFSSLFHQNVVVPRIFMTYGPGQRDLQKLVPYTILSLMRGETPKLSSGRRRVDWIYIDDIIDGLLRAAFSPNLQEITFDLGSGALVSVRELVEQITEMVGNGVRPQFGALPDRHFEPERAADTTFAQRALSWRPRIGLREGLARTIEWYRSKAWLCLWLISFVCGLPGDLPDLWVIDLG